MTTRIFRVLPAFLIGLSPTAWAACDPIISSEMKILDNHFNPSISAILNGGYAGYSQEDSEIKGFAVGKKESGANKVFS